MSNYILLGAMMIASQPDFASPEIVFQTKPGGFGTFIAISPDRSKAFSYDGYIGRIWEVETGRIIFPRVNGGESLIYAQFLSDEKLFLVTGEHEVMMFDLISGQLAKRLRLKIGFEHGMNFFRICASADGKKTAVVSTSLYQKAQIYDIEKGKLIDTLKCPVAADDVELSSDGKKLYLICERDDSVVADLTSLTYKKLPVACWRLPWIHSTHISEEGDLFLAADKKGSRWYGRSLSHNQLLFQFPEDKEYWSFSVGKDGIYAITYKGELYFGERSGRVRLIRSGLDKSYWLFGHNQKHAIFLSEYSKKEQRAVVLLGPKQPDLKVQFPDFARALDVRILANSAMAARYEKHVYLFSDGAKEQGVKTSSEEVISLAALKSRYVLAWVTKKKNLELFSLKQKKVVRSISLDWQDEDDLPVLEIVHDGLLVFPVFDKKSQKWDLEVLKDEIGESKRIKLSCESPVFALATDDKRERLAAVSWGRKARKAIVSVVDLKSFHVTNFKPIYSIARPECLSFLTPNMIGISDGHNVLTTFDLKQGEEDVLPLDLRWCASLSRCREGKFITAIDGLHGEIRLFELNDVKAKTKKAITGDWAAIQSVRYQRDDQFLATTEDGQILFGNTKTGEIGGRFFFWPEGKSWIFVDAKQQWDGSQTGDLAFLRKEGKLYPLPKEAHRPGLFFDKLKTLSSSVGDN